MIFTTSDLLTLSTVLQRALEKESENFLLSLPLLRPWAAQVFLLVSFSTTIKERD